MFEIREYKNEDHSRLIEMISMVLAEYKMSLDFTGPDKDLHDLQNIYFYNHGAFFIAELDDEIIGSVAVSRIDDEKCELRKLYVLKEHRNRGFGRILLDKAIDFASSNGYGKMELEVSQKHQKAISLYIQTGFIKSETPSCCPRCDFIYIRNLV
jgi:putative acetyltransferase